MVDQTKKRKEVKHFIEEKIRKKDRQEEYIESIYLKSRRNNEEEDAGKFENVFFMKIVDREREGRDAVIYLLDKPILHIDKLPLQSPPLPLYP